MMVVTSTVSLLSRFIPWEDGLWVLELVLMSPLGGYVGVNFFAGANGGGAVFIALEMASGGLSLGIGSFRHWIPIVRRNLIGVKACWAFFGFRAIHSVTVFIALAISTDYIVRHKKKFKLEVIQGHRVPLSVLDSYTVKNLKGSFYK